MTGRLFYLMGPSGAGKDSLLEAAREPLQARGCRVARRVITRSAEAAGEDAQAVSTEEFEQLRRSGAFALDWQANGLRYGIPRQIDDWLAAGEDVLVNGSRGYLDQARGRYPQLRPLLLTVSGGSLRKSKSLRDVAKRSTNALSCSSGTPKYCDGDGLMRTS